MAAPVVHFEIGSPDSQKAADFYREVLGWDAPGDGPSRSIAKGAEGGPTGMLNSLGHEPQHYVMVYAEVADIEATLAKVVKAGGTRIVGPLPLPDGRKFAWFRDPFGNILGLLSPKP